MEYLRSVDELRARHAYYKVVEKSAKARKKRRRVKKDLEDDIQAAEGYCVWHRHCSLTECDLLWRPMMRLSIKK